MSEVILTAAPGPVIAVRLVRAEAWEAGLVRRGQRVLLLGTGAGLTLGAALLAF